MTNEQASVVRMLHDIEKNGNRTLLMIVDLLRMEVKDKVVLKPIVSRMLSIVDNISQDTYHRVIKGWVADNNIDQWEFDVLALQLDIDDRDNQIHTQLNYERVTGNGTTHKISH